MKCENRPYAFRIAIRLKIKIYLDGSVAVLLISLFHLITSPKML